MYKIATYLPIDYLLVVSKFQKIIPMTKTSQLYDIPMPSIIAMPKQLL